MIISMKTINPNCWAPNGLDVPITAPPVANINNLYYSCITYSLGRFVYYRLEELVTYSFLNREDDYFNESD